LSGYQTSVANAHQRPFMLSSLPDVLLGPQTRVEVHNGQYAVQVDFTPDRVLFPRFETDTPQSYDHMTNEFWAITDVVANSSRFMTEETPNPMISYSAKPFPHDTRSPTSFTTSGTSRLRPDSMPQESNKASRTHNEGDHRGTPPYLCFPLRYAVG
jgi:hypothetical protein